MPDLIGLLRFGAPLPPANVTAPPPAPVASDRAVTSISASAGSSITGDRNMGQRPMMGGAKPTNADAGSKSAALAPPAPMDLDIITGPPPTFQASFLELQADLQLSLARIDAERTAAQGEASGAKQTDAKTSGTDRAKPAEDRVADKVATEDAAPIPQAAETAQSKTTEVLAQVG
ncbi:MAG: hypothetical protein NWS99_08715 [Paracoccaceae bacterium]|nr:hypothetical protein [Paracoccaceae bacterium]